MHGYQVMQELAERSGGRWRPSAGSVYPTLQQLEDEGLVTVEDRDGRRTFALTDAGRTAAEAIPADRPWSRGERGDDLRGLARELGIAAIQVDRRHPGRPGRGSHDPHRCAAQPLPAAGRGRRDRRLSRASRAVPAATPRRRAGTGSKKSRNRTTKLTISVTAKAIIAT